MNILVTGGAGFIGNALANKLVDIGNKVTIVDLESKIKKANCSKFNIIQGDLSDYSTLENINTTFDYIFHIAAQSSGFVGLNNPGLDIDCNVKGTVNVFRYAKKTGVKKVIYTSSMSVYGNGVNFTEQSPIDPTSHYGISKYTGELYCKQYAKLGVDFTIFRLFNVYGFGQDMENLNQGMVSIYIAQSLIGKDIVVKGSLDRYRDFIYIDDVVSALLLGLDTSTSKGIYNVCSGNKTTVKELLDMIIVAHKKKSSYFNINVIDQYEGDQNGASGNNSKLRELGWSPTVNLQEGIQKFVDSFI